MLELSHCFHLHVIYIEPLLGGSLLPAPFTFSLLAPFTFPTCSFSPLFFLLLFHFSLLLFPFSHVPELSIQCSFFQFHCSMILFFKVFLMLQYSNSVKEMGNTLNSKRKYTLLDLSSTQRVADQRQILGVPNML